MAITFKKVGQLYIKASQNVPFLENMESSAITPPKVHKVPKIKSLIIVTVGATVGFAVLNLYKGNDKFYRDFVMPAVRLLPAETSHNLGVWACKYNLFRGLQKHDDTILKTQFFGKSLSNPVGIAAGFDKHGEAVEGLKQIGFGFIEIGSVTPNPQSGNPTPRVFRLNEDEAIINRYGFNSEGHKAVYARLKALKKTGKFDGILGVNLGKNKESPSAVADYVQGVELFGPIADYLVVNVSSPNTPGLRDFQAKEELEKILERVIDTRDKLPHNSKVPILLKIAPDLADQEIKDIVEVIKNKKCRVDGLVVSNTTVARENLKEDKLSKETGGLSGAPLRERSTELIANLYAQTQGKIPIIGVGGISSGYDAFKKLEAGASYVQFYTALIYHGPPVVNKIKDELSNILKEQGYNNVQDVVGKNYKKYLNEKQS